MSHRAARGSLSTNNYQLPTPTALERLVFFSDAIFAIAITLLALDIRVPDPAGTTAAELPRQVLALAPNIVSFAVSFLVIGSYWLAHHRIFHAIVRYDHRLLWLNLLFLLCIAFMPFPSALLGRYGDTQFAVVFYAAFLALTGALLTGLWVYAAAGHRLVPRGLDRDLIRDNTVRTLASSAIFLASIGLSFVHPYAAEASWLAIVLIRPVVAHLDE
ncbi:MAG TPA: TMEM175 family protein [Thermomicrobiales bacterium]|nr:TMEM175 family protein [Thermomicrobiales bacterium]